VSAATGKLLRTARESAGLSQRALAELSGVSQPTLWQWEAGRDIRVSTVLRVAEGLGVEPAVLLPGAGALPPSSREHILAAGRLLVRLGRGLPVLTEAGILTMITLAAGELQEALRPAAKGNHQRERGAT
jgi:transcriptional regulator with XRE-family HTH domain